jgi:hypothetical protein
MKVFLSSTYVDLKDHRNDPETLRIPPRDPAFEGGVISDAEHWTKKQNRN